MMAITYGRNLRPRGWAEYAQPPGPALSGKQRTGTASRREAVALDVDLVKSNAPGRHRDLLRLHSPEWHSKSALLPEQHGVLPPSVRNASNLTTFATPTDRRRQRNLSLWATI